MSAVRGCDTTRTPTLPPTASKQGQRAKKPERGLIRSGTQHGNFFESVHKHRVTDVEAELDVAVSRVDRIDDNAINDASRVTAATGTAAPSTLVVSAASRRPGRSAGATAATNETASTASTARNAGATAARWSIAAAAARRADSSRTRRSDKRSAAGTRRAPVRANSTASTAGEKITSWRIGTIASVGTAATTVTANNRKPQTARAATTAATTGNDDPVCCSDAIDAHVAGTAATACDLAAAIRATVEPTGRRCALTPNENAERRGASGKDQIGARRDRTQPAGTPGGAIDTRCCRPRTALRAVGIDRHAARYICRQFKGLHCPV